MAQAEAIPLNGIPIENSSYNTEKFAQNGFNSKMYCIFTTDKTSFTYFS